jgi:hypothetical protein
MRSLLYDWMTSRSRSRVLCVTVVTAAALGLWACSAPTEFATIPEFLRLQPASFTVSAPTSGNRVPDDSCPRVLPPVATGTRRTLSEIGASIELPTDTRAIAHAFGTQPGAAFLSPSLGLIAFGYDSDLPTLLTSIRLGDRSSSVGAQFFTRWCPITINGVRATLFVDPYVAIQGATRSLAYGGEIAITTTSPSGRRVNIRISGSVSSLDSVSRTPNGLALVAAASGIQW